jgi:hypothetical protein
VITGNKQWGGSFLETEASTTLQCGLWNRVVTGKQHYRYLWLEALYFNRNLMPFISGVWYSTTTATTTQAALSG